MNLKTIHGLVEQIKSNEDEIAAVQQEIVIAQANREDTIGDEELNQLKESVEAKVSQYKLLLNEKSALFEEMYSNSLILINRDQQIIKNQTEIVQLKHEIDINILEIEQKTAIIAELQQRLQERKAEYKALKRDIKELEEQCEELEAILKQKEEELETLEDVLRDKEVTIEGLEKTLGEKAPILTADQMAKRETDLYKAVQGDAVDELLAKYINTMEINVPIRRMGDGFYLFGTRKIYAKVMN
jgi:chromosome segregation ATPase